MINMSRYWAIMMLACLQIGCASAVAKTESVVVLEQTAGRSTPFTQFELDNAYRKQAAEDANALNPGKEIDICCVLFSDEIIALEKVLTHFKKTVDADVNSYGILVQEDPDFYIVTFAERFRESQQYQSDGYWYPRVSDPGLTQYSYLVDRKTLRIIKFSKVPS